MHKGRLGVCIIDSHNKPISNAKVIINNQEAIGKIEGYSSKLRVYSSITNNDGYTRIFELETPGQEAQITTSKNKPFSVWDIWVKANGFRDCEIRGIEIFPGIISTEIIRLRHLSTKNSGKDTISIFPNAAFEEYPPKIPELAEKIETDDFEKIGIRGISLAPIKIVVHDGLPEDNTALNYAIEMQDYIKNVACCTMDPLWNENSLRAGILSIISFTLSRILTQHYRKKGRNFEITSSTAYDQLFSYGRNIYINISKIVKELYPTYIVESGQIMPLLIQCCNGIENEYPGWFSFYKGNALGQKGMTTKEILKFMLGEKIELCNFDEIRNEIGINELNRYRSFMPPIPPHSNRNARPKVTYPDDV